MLGEADELAGKFAKEADERYAAGSTCERTYETMTVGN
ncbi:protein gp55 [Salmonella enterica subsp. enterica serovar Newport str. SL317]|nr:protein gp55 [Salmonella enterica subsp. enterica serovar Newport str. SL317]